MRVLIDSCILNFKPAPREILAEDLKTYLRVKKPFFLWIKPYDEMRRYFQEYTNTLINGTVTWGHIIQVNRLLFEEGSFDCPGELVYSLEDSALVEPEYLADIAESLYSLKGTTPSDPRLALIADYLAQETTRVYGRPVPSVISPQYRCQISTTLFVRKHLPGNRIQSPFLPIIVNNRDPRVVVPLPAKYWPPSMISIWNSGG